MKPKAMDLEMQLRVPHVDSDRGFEVSPEGAQVAFSWNLTGQWEIYELRLDGPASPKQITGGPGGKFAPRYSPDGKYLAYGLDLDGGENFDIYLYDRVQGSYTNLTPGTPDAIQPNFSWSPDSGQIAFISNRSDRFATYIVPVTDGPGRRVLDHPYPDSDVRWSPDGRWLAVVAEARGQDFATFIVPTQGGETRQIADDKGAINAKEARWAPDSAHLVFSSDVHGYYDIGIFESGRGQIIWVTEDEAENVSPDWSLDGGQIVYVVNQGPMNRVAVHKLGEGSASLYEVGPGVHAAPRFTPDGKKIIFAFEEPRHPSELWALSLSDGLARQLTHSLSAELQDSSFVMPREVHYPGLDGVEVPALLFQPQNAKEKPPGVIVVHGGPNWLYQFTWMPLVQDMASRGWAVLAPNYRGSTGYGRAWQLASRFDLGGVDTADVVAGADYLANEGLADPARIGVTGRSHGGYLTMTALTQYPDRWAAGSAIVPFLNWFTAHANSREDLQHWDLENMGNPQENHNLWHDRSPYFFLDRIQAPVQLVCGVHDPRCPASESVRARKALLELGKQVDFALYEDEGHSFLKIENVIDAEMRRVSFLAKALESTGGGKP
ncbi:MAG TPA: S9 family peptidase [Anaerolineales bacterium]|nr:S9 family peptidase [Anaerolineales bacterium]